MNWMMTRIAVHFAAVLWVLSTLQTVTTAADKYFMERPFGVFALAGFDRLEEDLEQLGTSSGNQHLLQQFRSLQQKLGRLPGVDRQRAVGGLFVLPREQLAVPSIILLVPVSNGEQFIADIKQKFRIVQTISKGKWRVNVPNFVLYVNLEGDYLAISQDRRSLALVNSGVIELINEQSKQSDLFAEIDLTFLSQPLRDRITEGIEIDLEQERIRKPDENDEAFALRSQLLELIHGTVQQFVAETKTIKANLEIKKSLELNVTLTPIAGTSFANQLALIGSQGRLSKTPSPVDLPLDLQISLNVPASVKSFMLNFFEAVQTHLRKEIGPKIAEADRGPVSGAFDAIEQTIDKGLLVGSFSFRETQPEEMTLLAGLSIRGENLLKRSLETILPYARESEEIAEVEMNAIQTKTSTLHRLLGKDQRPEDRRLYGPDASLYVGTGGEIFWLCLSATGTQTLFEDPQQHVRNEPDNLLRGEFSLDPWLRLAEKHKQDVEKIKRFRRAFPDEKYDRLEFQLSSTGAGLSARISAEEGYFRLLGIVLENQPSPATAVPTQNR